jgi:Xaa-Pro dipeptidase
MSKLPEPVASPPDKNELRARLDRVRALMATQNLDRYVVFDPVNVYYLTSYANEGHERPFILIIARAGTPRMVVPLLELTHAQTRARCELEYITYIEFPAPEGENWYDVHGTLVPANGRVGIEPAVPVAIAERTPGCKIVADRNHVQGAIAGVRAMCAWGKSE